MSTFSIFNKSYKPSKARKIYKMVYNSRIYTGYNKDMLRDMILSLKRK